MAGKEIYIEPILDANLSVVPGLSENIAEMTAQLNETTRILTNVLANQGLEAHQEAYSGSAFSALTLSSDTLPNSAADGDWATLAFSWPKKGNYSTAKTHIFQGVSGASVNINHVAINLSDIEKISLPFSLDSGVTTTQVKAILYFSGGNDTITFDTPATASGTALFDIPEADRKSNVAITFVMSLSSNEGVGVTVYAPTFTKSDGTTDTPDICLYPKIGFNSVNALTYLTKSGIDNIAYPGKVYITLPDIATVGTWAVFLTNGNIEGVSLALVDDTTHDIITTLPAATSDISSVTQTSNLALSVSMNAKTQVIHSIAQRYY